MCKEEGQKPFSFFIGDVYELIHIAYKLYMI